MALSSLQSQNFISILAQQFLKGERKNRTKLFDLSKEEEKRFAKMCGREFTIRPSLRLCCVYPMTLMALCLSRRVDSLSRYLPLKMLRKKFSFHGINKSDSE